MPIKWNIFRGVQPRLNSRAKQGVYAEIARNVDLSRGQLDPWRCPTLEHDIGNHQSAHVKKCKWRSWPQCGVSVTDSVTGFCYVNDPCDCVRFFKDWCQSEPAQALGLPRPDPAQISSPVVAPDEWCTQLVHVRITYLNDCWQESAPSRASNTLKCAKDDKIVIDIPPPPTDKYPIHRICVYMSHSTWDASQGFQDPQVQQTGSILSNNFSLAGDVDCFKVLELPPGTQTAEITCEAPCGKVITTKGYLPPPDGMCLAGESETGSLVGFTDECLMFSERNHHHAWPVRNMMTFGSEISYACHHNLTTFVLTKDCKLFMVRDDTDCQDEAIKCRTVINVGNVPGMCAHKKQAHKQVICDRRGFYWVSDQGLMRVDENNPIPINTTSPYMTEQQWIENSPLNARIGAYRGSVFLTMPGFSGVLDNNIHGYYPGSADPTQDPIPQNLTELSYCPECWIEDDCGGLFMLDCDGKIYSWNTGDTCMPITYRTEPIYSNGLHTTAAQLEYDVPRCDYAGCKNNFHVYADGKLQSVTSVSTPRPFRTRRVRGHEIAVGYHGTDPVRQMCLGASLGDLATSG